jgi:hypothetical protein
MTASYFLRLFVLTMTAVLITKSTDACSMYKVTANGKTMVGNNEDSWRQDARIWFEPGTSEKYGIVCVGYAGKRHPDGAVNEYGLAFDAFSMPHNSDFPDRDLSKKDFAYGHLKTIMQQCKTVDEVFSFLNEMNLHALNGSILFNGGMLLFVDKTGKYLVVEAGAMTFGTDDKFVLANFSVADTKELSNVKTERYRKGVAFLSNKELDKSLSFCKALSDTMSVSRAKVGDGTLYTTIYDLEEGLIHLYFFHDFTRSITFNLKEELAKGEHSFEMAEMFSGNLNYQRFVGFKTPLNNRYLFLFMVVVGMLFCFSFLYFLISFLKKSQPIYRLFKLCMSALSLVLAVYALVLLRNEGIFYFPSPYNDGRSILNTVSAYLPILLLVLIVPLVYTAFKMVSRNVWKGFSLWLLVTNNMAYLVLLYLFAYWGLFDMFS